MSAGRATTGPWLPLSRSYVHTQTSPLAKKKIIYSAAREECKSQVAFLLSAHSGSEERACAVRERHSTVCCVCGVQCATRGKRGVCLRALGASEWQRGASRRRPRVGSWINTASIQLRHLARPAAAFSFESVRARFCVRQCVRTAVSRLKTAAARHSARRDFRRRRSVSFARLHPPCAFCKHTRSAETNGCWRSLSPPPRSRCRSRPSSANPWDYFLFGHDRDFANWSRPLLRDGWERNRVARRQIERGWSFIDLARKIRQ